MYGNYGDDRGFRPRNTLAPVKVGDELEVKIEAVGEKGDGIAKKDGFVLFVPNTKEGDQVKIRITKVLRKVGFAEVVGEGSGAPAESEDAGQEETSEQEPQSDDSGDSEESQDSDNFGEESENKDN